jgi:5-methylcytosine-specific restriction endonuclease McrA
MTAKRRQNRTKACDALFGKIIRARGACESCGQTWDLQCAHGFSRRYRSVRWDEVNAFCLCRGCHMKFTHRPLEWDDWLKADWGEVRYWEIRHIALTAPNPDLDETHARLKARWDEMEAAA